MCITSVRLDGQRKHQNRKGRDKFHQGYAKSKFTMEHERNKYLETQDRSQGKKELDLGVR